MKTQITVKANMIIKELLIEIFKDTKNRVAYVKEDNDYIIYNHSIQIFDQEATGEESVFPVTYSRIGIYKLMHKAKKWAWEKNFYLQSELEYDSKGLETGYSQIEEVHLGWQETFVAASEPEVVFKACEYIRNLEN